MRFSNDWWLEHRWRLQQAAVLATGLSLLLAAVFLLGGSWGGSAANGAAAFQPESTKTARLLISTPVPTARPGAARGPLFAQAFATATPTLQATQAAPPAAAPAAIQPSGSVPPPASAPVSTPTPVPSAPTNPPPPPAPSCPAASMSSYAFDLFNAINDQRAQNGMLALAADGCVTFVAQLRSDDMAARNYFSHSSPEGTGAFDLLDANGVPHGWAGENLARNNYPDAEAVGIAIRDLMASPGHRDIIVSGNYTALGVGYADDGTGMKYFTMVFIGPPL